MKCSVLFPQERGDPRPMCRMLAAPAGIEPALSRCSETTGFPRQLASCATWSDWLAAKIRTLLS